MSNTPQIRCLTLGEYQVNCYIVWAAGSKACAVIDPGAEPERILSAVCDLGLDIQAIFLTHGHFDHVGGVETLLRAARCPLYMSREDYDQPDDTLSRLLYPLSATRPEATFYKHMDTISTAGLEFTVYATPGHTRGSVCLACGGVLFTGDTLFAGACGRTDLPGGDPDAMAQSLEFLRALPMNGPIYPGHGVGSTLAEQRLSNPYLRKSL